MIDKSTDRSTQKQVYDFNFRFWPGLLFTRQQMCFVH